LLEYPQREALCAACGGEFTYRAARQSYCSTKCRDRFYHARRWEMTCHFCTQRFLGANHQRLRMINKGGPVYCSKSCAAAVNSLKPRKRHGKEKAC
jgi:hypothetical protein